MTITHRPFAGEDDYLAMRELLLQSFAITGPPEYGVASDLDWWRAAEDPEDIRRVRLWFDGDRLIGFLWSEIDYLDMFTHPDRRDLEAEILTWAEQRRRAMPTENGEATIIAWALKGDATRRALLETHGFERQDGYLLYWLRTLADLPDSPIAEGYTVRNVQGEHDIATRVAAHRSAFEPSKMTEAKHRRVQSMPGYRMDLDLMAVAPDGKCAAFCIVWHDARNRTGVFEPVGTHQAHQRKGLASAVMAEGLRRLAALGADTAVVLSVGGRDASYRLYESMGFRVLDRLYQWKKRL